MISIYNIFLIFYSLTGTCSYDRFQNFQDIKHSNTVTYIKHIDAHSLPLWVGYGVNWPWYNDTACQWLLNQ